MKQAGASSMWASCCGLLNEVMGTGTMRPPGGQTGFGPGARPFRFAPSAGYSTYPPATPSSSGSAHNNASVSAGLACKACGLAFSVFRRKYVCSDCRKSYCSLCSVLQENLRRCATCHLLWGTAFQRPRLMRLRVKDLRQYLMLRNIPTDTCREKEDLVELVMCTLGPRPPRIGEEEGEGEEEEERRGEEERPGVVLSPPQGSAPRSVSEHSELSITTSQDDTLSSSSGTSSQDQADAASLATLNLEDSSSIQEASPGTQRRARASLSDIATEDAIESLTVRQLKEILARNFVNFSGCCEKWELVERVHRLYRDNEQNRRSMENVNSDITAVTTYPPPICLGELGDGVLRPQLSAVDENLCRICMDAFIDCVLLECGHMVTCTKCGKRMNECPICRQYVVRAVHVFKS
ncbi:E3 ubiquitin-protein ligase RNF34 [Alosa sapidissima]|uniref:E3 ubiquitin-protein ligase RNF34 n=1 Tax=Alosa sapidissima TaxID=34773 RepID=UPI001C081D9D|nr:E3 ubiquitin-protein ligase RNF34 [Alosa sapidissima]